MAFNGGFHGSTHVFIIYYASFLVQAHFVIVYEPIESKLRNYWP